MTNSNDHAATALAAIGNGHPEVAQAYALLAINTNLTVIRGRLTGVCDSLERLADALEPDDTTKAAKEHLHALISNMADLTAHDIADLNR